ncbi:MAG TPA: response regulator [Aggregatilineaceae bacterium]|nr:response regulator [Aggregatilineaceae bacterium]
MAQSVLIVDDDLLLCSLLRIALRREGYDTHEVYQGNDALDHLKANQVDLILLDVMMADTNGFDVLRHLKADDRWKDIPVVFLTARVDAISQKTGLDIGAVEYLTKPITPDNLINRVRAIIGTP